MAVTRLTAEFGGRTLTIETGKLARLAGGSVTVRYGDTVVLGRRTGPSRGPGSTSSRSRSTSRSGCTPPGKIPGGFIKRESRPSEAAILAARLTDRPIRPLFPEGYKDDVQVVLTVLSTDQENDPDILGTIAASAALTISEIPFLGPIAAVRVGRIDGEFVLNPTIAQLEESEIDLVVSGTRDAIMMVEAGRRSCPRTSWPRRSCSATGRSRPSSTCRTSSASRSASPSACRTSSPAPTRVLDFVDAVAGDTAFVVVDVETTGRDAQARRTRRDRRGQGQGRRDRRPLVHAREPRPSIVGKQLHGITDADVAGRAQRRRGGRDSSSTFAGDAHARRPQRRLRPRASSRRRWRRGHASSRALPRHARPRPRGIPGPGRLQARRPGALLRLASSPTTVRCPTPRRPPQLLIASAAAICPAASTRSRTRSPSPSGCGRTGATRTRRDAALERRGAQPRASRRAWPRCSTRRPCAQLVLDEGIRMDGRGLDDDPADHRRGRAAAAGPRLGAVHARPDPGAHGRHARAVVGRPAHRHDQPGGVQALPPPLQHAALQHGREQADARSRPARDRPRRARRAGAAAGPAQPAEEFPYVIRLVSASA